MTDPYRENAAPEVVTKIVRTLEVSSSAFYFAGLLAVLLVIAAPVVALTWSRVKNGPAPEPCVESIKIIDAQNDDRFCEHGGRFVVQSLENQKALVRCVCSPAPEPAEAGAK